MWDIQILRKTNYPITNGMGTLNMVKVSSYTACGLSLAQVKAIHTLYLVQSNTISTSLGRLICEFRVIPPTRLYISVIGYKEKYQ